MIQNFLNVCKKMKVIPAIDLMNGQVVRLYKGDPNQKTVYSDDPISIAKKWQDAGADMIHLVDLDATLGLGSNLELIKKLFHLYPFLLKLQVDYVLNH